MKRFLSILLTAVFIFSGTLAFAGCSADGASAAGMMYVTIDINPSFELLVNRRGTVVSCVALNEDADTVLDGTGSLNGGTITDAVTSIVGSAADNGFLNEDNPVVEATVVSGDGNQAAEDNISSKIEGAVKAESAKSGRAFIKYLRESRVELAVELQEIKESEEYKDNQAVQTLGLGRYALIKEVMESCDLTFDEALALSNKELISMLKEVRTEQQQMAYYVRNKINEARKAFIENSKNQEDGSLLDKYLSANPDDQNALALKSIQAALETIDNIIPKAGTAADIALTEDEIAAIADVLGISAEELKAEIGDGTAVTTKNIMDVANRLYKKYAAASAEERAAMRTRASEIIPQLREIIKSVKDRWLSQPISDADLETLKSVLGTLTLPDGITLPDISAGVSLSTLYEIRSTLKSAAARLLADIRSAASADGLTQGNNNDETGNDQSRGQQMKEAIKNARDRAIEEWKGRRNGGN
jgi:hypothetical protein